MTTLKQSMRANVRLIQSNRNYTIIQIDNDIICFSFKKPICVYSGKDRKLVKFNKNIVTETNKKHFAFFLKYLQKTLDN